jgi:hypothetical protein
VGVGTGVVSGVVRCWLRRSACDAAVAAAC